MGLQKHMTLKRTKLLKQPNITLPLSHRKLHILFSTVCCTKQLISRIPSTRHYQFESIFSCDQPHHNVAKIEDEANPRRREVPVSRHAILPWKRVVARSRLRVHRVRKYFFGEPPGNVPEYVNGGWARKRFLHKRGGTP